MDKKSIREGLLEIEKRTPEFEERFRKEMKKMMNKTLTRTQKVAWSLSILLGLVFVVHFSYVAVTAPPEFPFVGRMMFLLGPVFGAGWIGLAIWTLRRKTFNRMRQENMAHGLTLGFLLMLLVGLMLLGSQLENKVIAVQMTLQGAIFFMIFGIPALFNLRINRMESTLREHLLKLELKVAELADTMQEEK